jgi:UDP-N-acetylglucosamine 2-epimerase (non-hydrolysing)
MIDTLVRLMPKAEQRVPEGLPPSFALVTLHRSNVDDLPWLEQMLSALERISDGMPVLFPVPPRTRQRLLEACGSAVSSNGIRFLDPLPYLDFLAVQSKATIVITDS